MKNMADIYAGAEKLLNRLIAKEMRDQGHYLNGAMENTLESEVSSTPKEDLMEGYAVYYAKFVNDGFRARSASMKQWPYLFEYFKARGFPEKSDTSVTAGALAAMTIRKWMREGMPTEASKRFSKTGSRTKMIQHAFEKNEDRINKFMANSFERVIQAKIKKEKDETI